MTTPKFPIGTQFRTRGKYPRLCTVVDIHRTYNSDNELVKTRYVATHMLSSQIITDYDVVETTIAMGLVKCP